MNLHTIRNEEGAATASSTDGPVPAPLEDLAGWALSAYNAESVGVECIVLTCEGGAAVNPIHSGGDVHWLGYVAEGTLELLLGDADGNQTSSRQVGQGDTLIFEPETYHGWVPGPAPAKLIFMKTSGAS